MFLERHLTTGSDRIPTRIPLRAGFGLGLVAALALAACSSGSGSTASSGAAPNHVAGSVARGAPATGDGTNGAAQSSAGGSGKSLAPTTAGVDTTALQAGQEALARRATIALQVKDIGQAVAKVRATSAAAQGIILAESIGTSGGPDPVPLTDSTKVSATTYAEITLSVPSDQLDGVLDDLGSVGKVIQSTSSSDDVGSQIVDTQSRLATMRVSVARVRGFLDNAKDLTQVVTLEAELTRRESDLEALEAQLASLKGSVARSPVQVSLTTQPAVIVPPQPATGFFAGLKGGWSAFVASVAVLLTVVGAVLPFAVLAALLALPVWWFLRRRRVSTPPPVVSAS
jgi:hypothetical protein